jgi:solute carrier family 8 (sodium/calcium exchanger)
MAWAQEAKICEAGGEGIFFPLSYEQDWDKTLRGFLYGIGLFWAFMGVAIIADVFMAAIETITSVERDIVKENGEHWHVKVWNPTVANLTLMALGSSAPEILLNVIEILNNKFFAGSLGPSTIVGSAAFNLLIIMAVCVSSLPLLPGKTDEYEMRRISNMDVYCLTASFSVFAYIWLYIILAVWTKDLVTLEEAVITFCFFPVFVCLAYYMDTRMPFTGSGKLTEMTGSMDKDAARRYATQIKVLKRQKPDMTDEELHVEMEKLMRPMQSRAACRINATRQMFGGKRILNQGTQNQLSLDSIETHLEEGSGKEGGGKPQDNYVEFAVGQQQVPNTAKSFKISVHRGGDTSSVASVQYEITSVIGEGDLFHTTDGVCTFSSGSDTTAVEIKLTEAAAAIESGLFEIALLPSTCRNCTPGPINSCQINLDDSGSPGILSFKETRIVVSENVGSAKVIVQREHGSHGKVSCRIKTVNGTAVAPADYTEIDEELVFEDGEDHKIFLIGIVDDEGYEKAEYFTVEITDAEGAVLDEKTDGGAEKCVLKITIEDDDVMKSKIDGLMAHFNVHKLKVGGQGWLEQFMEAVELHGENGPGTATCMDTIMYFISLPWKLLFAIVPPTTFAYGWATFWVALGLIGIVTAFIGDLAALFGCILGIEDEITAITFVALGTSLPDTFASMSAAAQDPTADNAVGNVTGSNSVNVFLGLGLPWLLAAIVWNNEGKSPEWLAKYGEGGTEAHMEAIYPAGGFVVMVSVWVVMCVASRAPIVI